MVPYQAIFFDFDYTLGDATPSILAGFAYGLDQLGWPAPDADEIRRTVGYPLEESYTKLTRDRDPIHREQFRAYFTQAAQARQREEAVLLPGATELLRWLGQKGVKRAVVSTKRADTLRGILEHRGVANQFEVVLGGDDVSNSKPDPEGLLLAMEQLEVSASQVLYCGDTVLDAEAAQRAGCHFSAVLNGTTPRQDFFPFPHVHIAPDLSELLDWLRKQAR